MAGVCVIAGPGVALGQDNVSGAAAKAEQDGVVRLIARLPTAPTMTTADPSAPAFRAAVVSGQAALRSTVAGVDDAGVIETFETVPLAVVEAQSAEAVEALAEQGIAFVEDTLSEPTLAQSVPLVNAAALHADGLTGSGQTVAVLDTGVETTHPAFAGRVAGEACFSTTSTANGGSTSLCPNGAGSQTGGDAAQGCPDNVSGCDHGTHVAGIVLGDGGGVTGVAPAADLLADQVFSEFGSASACNPRPAPCVLAYTSDQIRGLDHVRSLAGQFDIAAVNMSLGGGRSETACDDDVRKDVMDALRGLGIATVVSSGNNGFSDAIGFPACISTAIAVGSTTKADALSGFSNSSQLVELLAPGSSIVSAVFGGGTGGKSGTSMAAPHVAGAFALAMASDTSATVANVLDDLKQNGIAVTGRGITKPRIDLSYLQPATPAPEPSAGPLAFGVMWFDGRKMSGTDNWSATFNATHNRYEVTIDGEAYHYLRYATIVTPAGDIRFCRTSSVDGKLLIYCADAAGAPASSRIAFATFKP